ncbi:MAG: hypothetical protein A2525_12610 [Sulfurimonas sp. RIFOXYD12_FULL_36_11]|nr:MAG: hypothetical protein A2345_12385 [Sulfurimonas sp. RIFOXYB12_FULL_35_9]OHE17680.1 MAG: hypothetical protein A2525_12610 [Sulfurimonas sp. RIFOXYD12_FULL_36_11]
MPDDQISLKHNKHRIHPCPNDKKLSLLNLLIAQNATLDIVVATAEDTQAIKEAITASNVKVLNDKELLKLPELRCKLLISYDLPSTAILYMARVAKATEGAIILLDKDEQKQLYPIETLLGRVIRQEIVAGFEYAVEEKIKREQKPFDRPKRDGERSERKPFEKPKYDKPKRDSEKPERKPFDKPKYDKPKRDGESSERKPFDKPKFDKPKRDGEKSEQKAYDKPKRDDKKSNKFLGKDESGKAKFSGKSGERNHRYDGTPKEKYEAPKNVGRKISIKERKPTEDSKPNS